MCCGHFPVAYTASEPLVVVTGGHEIHPRLRGWVLLQWRAADMVDASDRTHGQINQRFGDPADLKVTHKAMDFLQGILKKEKTAPKKQPLLL